MGCSTGESALADYQLCGIDRSVAEFTGGERATASRYEHVEVEGFAAHSALHRLSLREAGYNSQNHSEGSAAALRHSILGQWPQASSATRERLAFDTSRIQSGVV